MASRMTKTAYRGFTRLIGALASDVHEMQTIVQHIAALPAREREATLREVLLCTGYASSGYTNPQDFLNAIHWYFGQAHMDIVRDFQRWASPRDPALDDEASLLSRVGALYARELPSTKGESNDIIERMRESLRA